MNEVLIFSAENAKLATLEMNPNSAGKSYQGTGVLIVIRMATTEIRLLY